MGDTILINTDNCQKISAIYKVHNRPLSKNKTQKIDHPLIIMAHDFPGHKSGNNNLYADLEFLFSKKGYHTLRFDFRGCGESDGRQEDFTLERACQDFQYVRYWAQQKGYKNFAYIGEGLGATVSLMNINNDVKVLLVLWPVVDLQQFGQTVFNVQSDSQVKLKNGFMEMEGYKISRHFINEMECTNILSALKEVKMPTMVFHGVQDQKIPIEQLDLIRKHVQSRRIEITSFQDGTEGLQKLNHRRAIFDQAQQFVEKYA